MVAKQVGLGQTTCKNLESFKKKRRLLCLGVEGHNVGLCDLLRGRLINQPGGEVRGSLWTAPVASVTGGQLRTAAASGEIVSARALFSAK